MVKYVLYRAKWYHHIPDTPFNSDNFSMLISAAITFAPSLAKAWWGKKKIIHIQSCTIKSVNMFHENHHHNNCFKLVYFVHKSFILIGLSI